MTRREKAKEALLREVANERVVSSQAAREYLAACQEEKGDAAPTGHGNRSVKPSPSGHPGSSPGASTSFMGTAPAPERTAESILEELRETLACQFQLRCPFDGSHPQEWGKGSLGRDSMDDFDEALRLVRELRAERDEYMNKGLKACIENESLKDERDALQSRIEKARAWHDKISPKPWFAELDRILSGAE